MKPTVVHLKRKGGQIVQDCDVYIGRSQTQGGWNLKKSEWANRFSAKTYTREESIRLYKNEFYEKVLNDLDTWIPKLEELRGKRLGCWCSPLPCHGNVIADLVEDVCKIIDETDENKYREMLVSLMAKLENP
jgi:hypothetical protein